MSDPSVIGTTVLQSGAVINGKFEMVKLLFHDDGTVTWKLLYDEGMI